MSDSKDERDDFEKAVEETGRLVSTASARVLQVDVAEYQRYLDDADLSEAQKKDVVEALWSIMVSFVELGFGIHPVQEVCGDLPEETLRSSALRPDPAYSEDGLDKEFQSVAGESETPAA